MENTFMEPHAPHHPIHTKKEFFTHLAIVTLGILIALGLENCVQLWHRHVKLAEARSSLLEEIENNEKLLEDEGQLPYRQKKLDFYTKLGLSGSIEGADEIFKGGLHLAPLDDMAWKTFLTSDVTGMVPFRDRTLFAKIYEIQGLRDTLTHAFLTGLLSTPRSDRRSPDYLHDQIRVTSLLLTDIVHEEQVLLNLYGEAGRRLRK